MNYGLVGPSLCYSNDRVSTCGCRYHSGLEMNSHVGEKLLSD
jgi:hypothetical protein